jgi:hypothetical protein
MLYSVTVSKTPLEVLLQPHVQYRSVHKGANSVSFAALGYKIFSHVLMTKWLLACCIFLSRTARWSEILTSALKIEGYWVVTLCRMAWVIVIDV